MGGTPPSPGMHWKGGGSPPLPRRLAYAQPMSPWRQVPRSMVCVTDSNRPQPLWQPPGFDYKRRPHPDRPPPLIILWGAFFVTQMEAKALSFGIPAPKGDTPKLCHYQELNLGLMRWETSTSTTELPSSSDTIAQQMVHRFNMFSQKNVRQVKSCHLHTCHLHNNKAEKGTSKQPDKATVTKERRGQPRKPSELWGGVQSFRPTHPAGDPPTQTPSPIAT